MSAVTHFPALSRGASVRVTGPNLWGETEDVGRSGHITVTDDFGGYGIQFDDDLAPLGSYFTPENLEVMS